MSLVTFDNENIRLYRGDCLKVLPMLPDESVHCCVTSPPYYGLRDYGHDDQIGLESTPQEYIAIMVNVFREVRRVLRNDGTLWLNLGDSYGGNSRNARSFRRDRAMCQGVKRKGNSCDPKRGKAAIGQPMYEGRQSKQLLGMPWRVALALQDDGWILRQDIIWHKLNPLPESVRDRCTKAHEYIFLLSKSRKYYYDSKAIAQPMARSSIRRLNQDTEHQLGSNRVPGKTNGNMKAVGPRFGGNKYADDDAFNRTKSGYVWDGGNGLANKRSVWTVATHAFKDAHFATFPPSLIEPCILAGSPEGGTVLDPFNGAGTTGLVSIRKGRGYIGIELNEQYAEMTRQRLEPEVAAKTGTLGMFAEAAR